MIRSWTCTGTAAVAALALHAGSGLAQTPGFELNTVVPAPAGDRFFLAADGGVSADAGVNARLFGSYAYKPLLRRVTPRGTRELVSSQLLLDLGGSYALDRRWLFALDVPVVAAQTGDDPASPEGGSLGDLRLAVRARIVSIPGLDFGAEVRGWIPTGSPAQLSGDDSMRVSLHAAASGRVSLLTYGANLGFLARERQKLAGVEVGPALPFSLGVGALLLEDALHVGLELQGATVVGGDASPFAGPSTPLVGLLGAKLRAGSLVFGAAGGPGLSRAPGVAPRVLFSAAWEPLAKEEADEAPEAAPAEEPAQPAEKPEEAAPPPEPSKPEPPKPEPPKPEAAPAPTPAPVPPAAPLDEAEVRAQARVKFNEGVAAYDQAHYADAAAAFGTAYSLRPHPVVLRNLAQSELMSGRLPEACQHFKQWTAEEKKPSKADAQQAKDGIAQACH